MNEIIGYRPHRIRHSFRTRILRITERLKALRKSSVNDNGEDHRTDSESEPSYSSSDEDIPPPKRRRRSSPQMTELF
jgi:hypothetical protein